MKIASNTAQNVNDEPIIQTYSSHALHELKRLATQASAYSSDGPAPQKLEMREAFLGAFQTNGQVKTFLNTGDLPAHIDAQLGKGIARQPIINLAREFHNAQQAFMPTTDLQHPQDQTFENIAGIYSPGGLFGHCSRHEVPYNNQGNVFYTHSAYGIAQDKNGQYRDQAYIAFTTAPNGNKWSADLANTVTQFCLRENIITPQLAETTTILLHTMPEDKPGRESLIHYGDIVTDKTGQYTMGPYKNTPLKSCPAFINNGITQVLHEMSASLTPEAPSANGDQSASYLIDQFGAAIAQGDKENQKIYDRLHLLHTLRRMKNATVPQNGRMDLSMH